MNKILPNFRYQIPVYSLLLIVFTGVLFSCAKKVSFIPSPLVPQAEGIARIKKDKNNNYEIQVNITYLPPASKIDGAKDTYVVWAVTTQNNTKKLGQINTSNGLLSSKYKASLTIAIPEEPTRIYITSEYNALVEYPGPDMIMSTKTF
ncbi:MAG: hypothetical protein ABIT96_01205 [Ferruginibacter sp.]